MIEWCEACVKLVRTSRINEKIDDKSIQRRERWEKSMEGMCLPLKFHGLSIQLDILRHKKYEANWFTTQFYQFDKEEFITICHDDWAH